MQKKPTKRLSKKDKLWKLCKEFVEEQEVSCPEAICQNDNVIENAYDLIEDICKIVGYHKFKED